MSNTCVSVHDAASLVQRFEVITLPISRNGKSTKATCKLQPTYNGRHNSSIRKKKKFPASERKVSQNALESALFAQKYNIATEYFSYYKSIVYIL